MTDGPGGSDVLLVLVVALAAYRVARLVTKDSLLDAPRDWLLRSRFGRWKASELLVCPFCVGVWAALGLFLGWVHGGRLVRLAALLVAATGMQSLLSAADGKMDE